MTEHSKQNELIGKIVMHYLLSGKDSGEAYEYGIIVNAWYDDSIKATDCYVAFWGSEIPRGKPAGKPYIMQYALSSLDFV